MLYPDAILVSLSLSSDYLTITTTDHPHGRSQRFYANVSFLRSLLDKGASVHDFDLLNSLQAWWINGDTIGFRITWLHSFGSHNGVHGYQQRFSLPMDVLVRALDGISVKHVILDPEHVSRCPVMFTDSANDTLHRVLNDRRKKRALIKALRDHFHWPNESVTLYRDFRDDFCFSARTLNGGLCLHQRTVMDRNGEKHTAFAYEVHT